MRRAGSAGAGEQDGGRDRVEPEGAARRGGGCPPLPTLPHTRPPTVPLLTRCQVPPGACGERRTRPGAREARQDGGPPLELLRPRGSSFFLWSRLSLEPFFCRALEPFVCRASAGVSSRAGAGRREAGGGGGGGGGGSGADGARGQAEEASKGQGAEGNGSNGGAAEADGPASGPPTEAGEVPAAPFPAPPLPPPAAAAAAAAAAPRLTGVWSHFAAPDGCLEPFCRA